MLQAIRAMDVALVDDGTRARLADADAFLVTLEPIGVALASSVDERITIFMQSVKVPKNIRLGARSVIHGRLAFVFVELLRRLVRVTSPLTLFDGLEIIFVALTTSVEESATSLGRRVKIESARDVVTRPSGFGQTTDDLVSRFFQSKSFVDEGRGNWRRCGRRIRRRIILFSFTASRLAFDQVDESVSVAIAAAVVKPFARLGILIEIPSDDVIATRAALSFLTANVIQSLRSARLLTIRFHLEIILTRAASAVQELMAGSGGIIKVPTDGRSVGAETSVGWLRTEADGRRRRCRG